MNPEQIVRETLAAIEARDFDGFARFAADDFTIHDPTLPRDLNRAAFVAQMTAILGAFPDWKYVIQSITTQDNQVTAVLCAVATHSAPLQLPGMPPIPATNKAVNVPDRFIFTIKDGKISRLTVDSPPNGGAAEMLRQLGITLPSR